MKKTIQPDLARLPLEDDLGQLQWLYHHEPGLPDLETVAPDLLKTSVVRLPHGLLPLGEMTTEDLAFVEDIMKAKVQLSVVFVAMADCFRNYL